jgi:hypothetical protein
MNGVDYAEQPNLTALLLLQRTSHCYGLPEETELAQLALSVPVLRVSAADLHEST